MKTKMLFSNDGEQFVGVYSDNIQPLTEALDMKVSRVSDVEYDHKQGVWKAHRKDGKLLAVSKSRDECVKAEVIELNKTLPEILNI